MTLLLLYHYIGQSIKKEEKINTSCLLLNRVIQVPITLVWKSLYYITSGCFGKHSSIEPQSLFDFSLEILPLTETAPVVYKGGPWIKTDDDGGLVGKWSRHQVNWRSKQLAF